MLNVVMLSVVMLNVVAPYILPVACRLHEMQCFQNALTYLVVVVNYMRKTFMKLTPGACIIKLITTVIYGFLNKLECLTLNTRQGWEGLKA